MTRTNLLSDMHAGHWAEDFVRFVKENPEAPTDVDTMLAWFSGAIMCGYDAGRRRDADDE